MAQLFLLFLSFILFTQGSIASEKQVNSVHSSSAKLTLLPDNQENISAKEELEIHDKMVTFENKGPFPLKNFSLHTSSSSTTDEDDENQLLKVYQWIKSHPECLKDETNLLAKVAGLLQIPVRPVPMRGRITFEYYWGEDWHFIDDLQNMIYLDLDNKTLVGYEEIVDDPLIALRTKTEKLAQWGSTEDIIKSWENFSKFEVLHQKLYPEFTPPPKNLKFSHFDLYPGERLIAYFDAIPEIEKTKNHESIFCKIEQHVSIKERSSATPWIYQSGCPIYRVINHSDNLLTLNEVSIAPGQAFDFADEQPYTLQIKAQALEGDIEILSYGLKPLLPWLSTEEKTLTLDSQENSDHLAVAYSLSDCAPSPFTTSIAIKIPSENSVRFLWEKEEITDCEKIWWQISSKEDFSLIIPNFEAIQPFESELLLDGLTMTFFQPNEDYFFRAKGFENGQWTAWSAPFPFTIQKPHAPQGVRFENIDQGVYEISWKTEKETSDINYLIFGSNAFDFIPSIFYDQEICKVANGQIFESTLNKNLIYETNQNKIRVDAKYAFYRIVAEKNGVYSVPSPIIRVYDYGLTHPRTVLQFNDDGIAAFSERMSFPPAYSYLKSQVELPSFEGILHLNEIEEFFSHQVFNKEQYVCPPGVSQEVWDTVTPYLLPENHPIKSKLDRLFGNSRVNLNSRTLKKAGFTSYYPHGASRSVITRHPKIRDYFLKLYLDDQENITDWKRLLARIIGALSIRDSVRQHGYKEMIVVPQKWLYPLPPKPSPPPSYNRKNFVLVAEDMHIVSNAKNKILWKEKMTRELLKAVYTLIDELGLADSVFAFNIPFTMHRKITFIDTEIHHRWPINYKTLLNYLSPDMQDYLKHLIEKKAEAA